MKKLRDIEEPLANFFASGVLRLADTLGPILWQFPPNFGFNAERFARFLELLPKTSSQAAELAECPGERLHGAEHLYASGYTDAQLDWWAERILAWRAGAEPDDARHVTGDAPPSGERDVYVYFDNDAKVHAPFDAMRLAERLTG